MTWATSVPILVFLRLSVLDLGPMYARDRRQTDVRQTDRQTDISGASFPNAPALGAAHNNDVIKTLYVSK